jgi:S1-C subfamily serine protease
MSAKVVKVDAANDLALLKTEGRFAPLPITASRVVKLAGQRFC